MANWKMELSDRMDARVTAFGKWKQRPIEGWEYAEELHEVAKLEAEIAALKLENEGLREFRDFVVLTTDE